MAIEYKTVTYRTVESANDNATYCWVELSAAHVPAVNGLIKRIVIQGATTSATGMTTDPMYLGIWERQADGGLISLGCSKNAVTQAINQQSVWDFDGAIIRGKSLLLGLLSSPDEHWTNNTQLLLRSRVQTNDTDGCVILTNIGRLKVTPDITFTVDVPEYVPDADPEPEPEPESEQRVIDISKYWIPIIRKTANFQQIAAAENPEFNLLSEKLYDLEKDGFILTATEPGVKHWEQILGLVASDGMTLDERKGQILNYLNVKRAYTIRTLRQMIAAIVGDGNFKAKVDNETSTLHMSLTADAMSKTNDINQLLKRIQPGNLVVKYDDIPMDYTLLEYLESSGTQYIALPETFNINQGNTPNSGIKLRSFDYKAATYNFAFTILVSTSNEQVRTSRYYIGRRVADDGYMRVGLNGLAGLASPYEDGKIYNAEINYLNSGQYVLDEKTKSGATAWVTQINEESTYLLKDATCKLVDVKFSSGTEITRNLVPVLDDKDVPCMYDTVSHTCFRNEGTGTFGYRVKGAVTGVEPKTFSLRDPYYVAPSGVWAKLIDENTLDIITALDPTVDESQGYKLFANVGDAYQYFNIEEVIENE